ncbi:hypothetical protein [Streptomyces sp. NRRL S-237]|uniref:hypothetical protein n=1 Tax=Streptomyces sp. NRRL S-237 TaxID=1463895 RepID=UPI00131D31B8|nr:hypothetical protein [Streptomyces sp. NRRL S-237]
MVWKEPSGAEQRLCEQLAAHGLSVSWAKIRRWREFGALPWKKRQGLGRGAGSSSELLPETFAVAAALALATTKKRPLEQAVLEVFTTGTRLDQVVAAATVPLPERAVRRALAWYMAQDHSHPFAAIEMAARSAGGCPDKAMDAALEAAHRYFPKLYRQAKQKGQPPGMTVPDSLADADGLATFAVAIVLGFEEFGADAVVEAVRKSLPELTDEYGDEVFARLSSALRGAEGDSASLWSRRTRWPSLQDRIQRMEQVEYAQLCRIRDALTLLVDASPALELARRAGVEDPDVRHVEAVRALNRRTDEYLRRAEAVSRYPAERAWKGFTGLLLHVCSSPGRLSAFQGDVTVLDPALNDIPGLGRRVLARCMAAPEREAGPQSLQ